MWARGGDVAASRWLRALLERLLATSSAPSGRDEVAGGGNRGEEVGGGWLMIGGADFEEEEGEGPKWQGGLLYIAGGARVGGFSPFRSRSISIGRPGAEGVR